MGQLYSLYSRSVPDELKDLHRRHADTFTKQGRYNVLNVQPHNSHNKQQTGTSAQSPGDATTDRRVIAEQLNKQILAIQSEYIDETTGKVQYLKIGSSDEFKQYVDATRHKLVQIDLYALSPAERKVLLLNIYNALVIHGNIVLGVPTITQLQAFYGNTAYMFANNTVLSLDDIEHGVLRNNSPHPISHKRRFTDDEPRTKLGVPPDGRIHFALNCGAASCPPIRVYTMDNAERALTLATRSFIKQDGNCVLDTQNHTLTLSKLFDWYKADFGSDNDAVVRWVIRHLNGDKPADELQQLLDSRQKYTIKYVKYDWAVNSSH